MFTPEFVITIVGLSCIFTLLWMRNLQRAYERLEERVDCFDVEVDELILSVEALQDIATPFDAFVFAADLTEEQEWDVRFVFAEARARLWSSEGPDACMPWIKQEQAA